MTDLMPRSSELKSILSRYSHFGPNGPVKKDAVRNELGQDPGRAGQDKVLISTIACIFRCRISVSGPIGDRSGFSRLLVYRLRLRTEMWQSKEHRPTTYQTIVTRLYRIQTLRVGPLTSFILLINLHLTKSMINAHCPTLKLVIL